MIEKLNEKIAVIYVSNPQTRKKEPRRILWRGREYNVLKIGIHHAIREGRSLVHIYTVSTESVDMKLRLDTDTMEFTIEEVIDGT